MSSQLWIPGVAGPHDDFVQRLLRQIAECGERPFVEIELADGARLAIESIAPEPGYGFVTLRPHPSGEPPESVIVPLGWIRRIEISEAAEPETRLGFTLPG